MLHIDGGTDVNLPIFRKGLKSMETGGFHEADHVGRGIDRRQLAVMSRERVLELNGFFDLGVRADGNRAGHGNRVPAGKIYASAGSAHPKHIDENMVVVDPLPGNFCPFLLFCGS